MWRYYPSHGPITLHRQRCHPCSFYDGLALLIVFPLQFRRVLSLSSTFLQGEFSLAKSSTVVNLLSDQGQVHNKAIISSSRILVFGYLAWEQQSATSRWRYKQSNWKAILIFSCHTTNVNRGKCLLTHESMANILSYGCVCKGARTPHT